MSSKLPYLTSDQDAEFDLHIRVWQDRLGLLDWRIERGRGNSAGAMSKVKCHYPDRLAVYKTGNWPQPVTTEALESTAIHELLHVMLSELTHVVSTNASSEIQYSVEHRIVNTLEKLLSKGAK